MKYRIEWNENHWEVLKRYWFVDAVVLCSEDYKDCAEYISKMKKKNNLI